MAGYSFINLLFQYLLQCQLDVTLTRGIRYDFMLIVLLWFLSNSDMSLLRSFPSFALSQWDSVQLQLITKYYWAQSFNKGLHFSLHCIGLVAAVMMTHAHFHCHWDVRELSPDFGLPALTILLTQLLSLKNFFFGFCTLMAHNGMLRLARILFNITSSAAFQTLDDGSGVSSWEAGLFCSISATMVCWTMSYFSWIRRLYQASSRSRMSKKFLSSGRVNDSQQISPGSFSWRQK